MSRVDGYAHGTGDHCGSTSLRNLSIHFAWNFDEPTCFGLASGLGFTYFELEESPHRGFFGRPLWIEDAFFEHLGIAYESFVGEPWETVVDRLRSRTAAGDPVLIYTDIFHLAYFDTGTHFAPHTLLVVGVTDDEVVLSDSEFDSLQHVPLADLQAAMASNTVFDLDCRHLVVTDPEPTVEVPTAARTAIGRTARYMLDPESVERPLGPGTHGIAGIRAVADELPTWTDLPDPQWTVRFAYQNVERRGTGGGTFRRLYAQFLDRMAETLPEFEGDLVERTLTIADEWTAIAELLKTASEIDDADSAPFADYLAEASAATHAVADREERLFVDLRRSIDENP